MVPYFILCVQARLISLMYSTLSIVCCNFIVFYFYIVIIVIICTVLIVQCNYIGIVLYLYRLYSYSVYTVMQFIQL